jgi:sulfonate transport system substrate-binding protein
MLSDLFPVPLLNILKTTLQVFKQPKIRTFSLLFSLGIGLSLVAGACSASTSSNSPATQAAQSSATNSSEVRIGYQKSATVLNAMKARGQLEKALAASGATVKWAEFPSGPPMLEAMNAGSIDFGYTGEAPPVFAQAAGTPLVYVAYDPLGPKAEAIIVPKDSPIKTVANLKGKRVAFAKGSNTNYLVVKAIEKAGLQYSDIKPAFLAPADARAAFEGRNIDAWAIWDPYLAAAEKATGARTLTDATGLAPNRGYYLAAKSFTEKRPDVLKTVLAEVSEVSDWAKQNPAEVAKFLSPELGIDIAALEVAEKRREYGVLPITDEVIAAQQQVADAFYKINLMPKQIVVKEIVWQGNVS